MEPQRIEISITTDELCDKIRAIVRSELAKLLEELKGIEAQEVVRLTVKQAARRYNFSEYSLRNKIFLQQIPVHRQGGSVYFLQHEFEEWLRRK